MDNPNQKKNQLKCYECNGYFDIPADYVGNKYVLLEIHYMSKHGIDLKTVNWNKPKRVIDDLDEAIATLKDREGRTA